MATLQNTVSWLWYNTEPVYKTLLFSLNLSWIWIIPVNNEITTQMIMLFISQIVSLCQSAPACPRQTTCLLIKCCVSHSEQSNQNSILSIIYFELRLFISTLCWIERVIGVNTPMIGNISTHWNNDCIQYSLKNWANILKSWMKYRIQDLTLWVWVLRDQKHIHTI